MLFSRFKSYQSGTWSKTKFLRKDLWKHPINKYDICIIFGTEEMMAQLEEKFENELIKGSSKVVACRFPLVKKKPVKVLSDGNVDTVWVYDF